MALWLFFYCCLTNNCSVCQSASVVSYSLRAKPHRPSSNRHQTAVEAGAVQTFSSELLGTQPSLCFRASLMGHDRLSRPFGFGLSAFRHVGALLHFSVPLCGTTSAGVTSTAPVPDSQRPPSHGSALFLRLGETI